MRFFVQPTEPPRPNSTSTGYIAITLAAIFVLLAVAQLYSYEDFPNIITSMGLPGGRFFANVYAALLVTGEVVAIPFLLSMRLSPAMRALSMIAGWCVIVAWLFVSFYINMTTNAITNGGVLGATIPLSPGWWMVATWLVMAGMCTWVSWNMWLILKRTS